MIKDQEKPHDPLHGEHEANAHNGAPNWEKNNEGRDTLRIHQSNRSKKDVQKIL